MPSHIQALKAAGVTEVILAINYRPEVRRGRARKGGQVQTTVPGVTKGLEGCQSRGAKRSLWPNNMLPPRQYRS